MADRIMFDEIRVEVSAPSGLTKEEGDAVRKALDSRAFRSQLRKAIRSAFAGRPELAKVRVTVHC